MSQTSESCPLETEEQRLAHHLILDIEGIPQGADPFQARADRLEEWANEADTDNRAKHLPAERYRPAAPFRATAVRSAY